MKIAGRHLFLFLKSFYFTVHQYFIIYDELNHKVYCWSKKTKTNPLPLKPQ